MSKKCRRTNIGGQAVIEGVMMRGNSSMATAVRDEAGEIEIEAIRLVPPNKKAKILKFPFIRGVVAFFQSLVGGSKVLMRSASVFGEEETSKFDEWLSKKTKKSSMDIAIYIGTFLGLLLSIFLFFFLPQFITDFIPGLDKSQVWYYLVEGGVRITIFILYILLTSLLKDIKRTYMYHGAEHKTITCYEEGKELTVENVRGCKRVHDRCGTTFLFIVMVISILIFALINWLLKLAGVQLLYEGILGKLIRFGIKILSLPIVAGVSYEVLKLLSKTDSWVVYIFKLPGLLLQRITTREPDDSMMEVAIAAFNKVLEMENDPTSPELKFESFGTIEHLNERIVAELKNAGIDESSESEWIISRVFNIPRSQIKGNKTVIKRVDAEKALRIMRQRKEGRPLWYIFGDCDFFGYKIKVNESVLIPRPETEELCDKIIKDNSSRENLSILDLCTGSGAIAVVLANKINCSVSASDISEDALKVAKENGILNKVDITYINSNMFENIEGKFDILVSNPPYIKTEDMKGLQKEVQREPSIALDGGADGLDYYKVIARDASSYLNENGLIYMECGINQAEEIVAIFRETGLYKEFEIINDINIISRIIKVTL